ncbi:squalene synthase HpnD [Acidocella aquatica]|uniref:Squalene synthase HpnD n=1 Tax=Acidocella aquatica TaxID=1922313 RepID=A0ABQ6A7L1_9PROT|nr:presqualene diphosphate synthase HpnD [Acidocella aquatica]GLR67613.1 squalene synthase HpnD [Acidocella aquatica]
MSKPAADTAYVTALVKASGTSFYHGMKILPPPRRDAMYAIYAFCRVVDDIADDDDVPFAQKRAALDAWRERIAALYNGETDGPITRALLDAVRKFDLQPSDFRDIVDGMEMDAGDPIVAPTLSALDLYCDRVASAVGRLSVHVFGDSSPAARDVAHALGRGLQLTNILRDVGEDAARGRLYLPREFLEEAGITPEPQAALASPALPVVCARLATMAEQKFTEAEAAMARCNPRAMRPARLMQASYRPLLAILRRQNFNYSVPRVKLPAWRKLVLAARLLAA